MRACALTGYACNVSGCAGRGRHRFSDVFPSELSPSARLADHGLGVAPPADGGAPSSIHAVAASGVDHVSVYELTIEERTARRAYAQMRAFFTEAFGGRD